MYMKAIYRLEREGPGVTTSALATELGVAPASVSGMLKKLVSEGYVEHEVRGDIRLTRAGLEIAVGVVRRNRLAERLLTDVLGMPWDEVYAEACILEHAITDRVEDRLVVVLGDPQTCPHGHPIPPKDLTEPVRAGTPLAQVEPGKHVTVSGVTEQMPEMLRYLGQVGLRPGARLEVVEKAPLGGPVTIEVDGERHAISLELARTVMIA
jgi:DtxR family transcriptional regulator, Mn-dependent transcriptional regulator